MNKKKNKGTLRKVLRLLRPYTFSVIISIFLSALSVAATLYIPILIGDAIDLTISKGNVDLNAIVPILIRAAVTVAVGACAQWLVNAVNNRITCNTVRDIRKRAFEHIEILPFEYIDSHPVGEIVSRVISDADQFSDGLLLGFSQLFTGVVTIIGTLIFMLTIHAGIALAVVILTPLSIFVAKYVASHTHSMFVAQSETRGEQTALIDEAVTNQKVIRAFGREKALEEKFDDVNKRLADCSLKATFFSSLVNPSTRFINAVIYAVVAFIGAVVCIKNDGVPGAFTVGALSALLSYANQYTKPFNEISGVITELQNAMACAGRIFELTDETPQTPDSDDAVILEDANGNVTLDKVSFSYDKSKRLIEELSLDVKSGQKVAIVGPTGCGKTTLINLLMRFYDVDDGSIAVDGHDVRTITRKSLRRSYGMVLQDTWLREGTIRDNITMGKKDATDDEVIAAAKSAHAHSFIRRLPDGYDTVIGEDGGSLSQGQKQLLCIARVMLALPNMLILDEATSSIDTRTEMKIQKAFSYMMEGRTSFIVAHRLSTIREADTILVMKDGHIIEQGCHDELLSRNGFYAGLYNSQFSS